MHRTQVLLPQELHLRAAEESRARKTSLGEVVRVALTEYLAKRSRTAAGTGGGRDAVEALLLGDPFDDPRPDKNLARDVDHHLYGAPRRSKRRRARK